MGMKRACSPTEAPTKLRKIMGAEVDGLMYECSRYVWREKRKHCVTEPDRKFSSKRMALLYIAKKNSDSVLAWLADTDRKWDDVCSDKGTHAITPSAPFELERFLELPDDVLEEYGRSVGNILNVRKAPEGTIYRYTAVELATTSLKDLCLILSA